MKDKLALLAELFAAQRSRLERFIARRIRARQDIADVAQEVYLRMLSVKDIEAIRRPEAYLFTVADNVMKEQAVRNRRGAGAVDIDGADAAAELAVLSTIDAELDHSEEVERLREVLGQLSPKCREAVRLQYAQGMSYREIGSRLGISSNMVKKYLSYALAHCRRRMSRPG
ncbi:MAG: sigma-70 family RNA polymerase sigma factor [Proteobacteria bacterium]|nr:sigma-70 family RNA polymerase sigma factor [Pseudomonadota bacterium]